MIDQNKKLLAKSFVRYWHLIAITIGLSLISAMFEGIGIGLLIPFLQSLEGDGESLRTGVYIVDQYVLQADASQEFRIFWICGLILVSIWIRSLIKYASNLAATFARTSIVEDLRMRVIDQLQAVALSFYAKRKSGDVLNSLTNEVGTIAAMLGVLNAFILQGALLLVYIGIMVWISWELTAIVAFFFIALAVGLTRIVRQVSKRSRRVTAANSNFVSGASEFIHGVRTIRAFNQEEAERARMHEATEKVRTSHIHTAKKSLLVGPISQIVVGTVLIFVVLIATVYFVLPGEIELAFLLAFLFALFRMMPVIHTLNAKRGDLASATGAIERLGALLKEDDKPYLKSGDIKPAPLQDAIEFHDVWFSYQVGEPVLKDIDFRIERGKTTALVGASGAGKSTLVDLIPRFYDPTRGKITMDGVDLRELDLHALREKIGVVSQSTYVFNKSVRENIAYSKPGASFDEVCEVARQANALQFIEELEDGFDTVLGERGIRLSGGQRQRIAIARALLRNPEILILDEATSALDSVTESLIQESLENLMEGRTVVAIAHRLSTIENADKVVVLEEGRIVEQGSYSELLAQNGQLWKYHRMQYKTSEGQEPTPVQ